MADLSIGTEEVPGRAQHSIKIQPRIHWPRLLFLAEWTLIVLLLALFMKASFLRGWSSLRSEFPNYYLAAALRRHGIPLDRVYEWTWFQRQNDRLGIGAGLVSFAPTRWCL
jgi:hypothetical protein